jgi:hypothetical protein
VKRCKVLQGPAPPLADQAAIVTGASASMSGSIKWSRGMPLFATLQSDFHWQYLSRANTRWTCNPCNFFYHWGWEWQGACGHEASTLPLTRSGRLWSARG